MSKATSIEEIQRQREQGLQLIEGGLACEPFVDHGEIPLKFKQYPTSKLFESLLLDKNKDHQDNNSSSNNKKKEVLDEVLKENFFPCWSSRGHADISEIQKLVVEGYTTTTTNSSSSTTAGTKSNTKKSVEPKPVVQRVEGVTSKTNLWDETNAAINNVAMCRPSHDAWGINKIVLIFSDDFLQQRYEFPWWHTRPDIREAIQPILNVLQIPMERVFRLILASLPPAVTIPVHNDSGEWVKYTHRIHIPILVKDPNRILFTCGINVDHMQRIDCTPGHVFEINNQGKHFVSNYDDDHRVHLILDYVDADFMQTVTKPTVQLQPGEILVQTRRSIDRLVDRGKRSIPSFMILGAQKAGTTSLYEYIIQHPLVIPARRRETHCLDWRWNDKINTIAEQREWCHKFYYAQELLLRPSCITGDSTPSYLLDSHRVIPRLKQVFNWNIKFIVILRDPITRAESHYAMVTSSEGTEAQLKARGSEWRNKSFHQVMMEDLIQMKSCGLIPYWDIELGVLDQQVWETFVGSAEEDIAWDKYLTNIPLNTGSHCLIGRGLYELNLRPWLKNFSKADFLVLRLETMKDSGVDSTISEIWHHLELPPFEINDKEPKNTRIYAPVIENDTKTYLQKFFTPHNQRLESLLGDDWAEGWTY